MATNLITSEVFSPDNLFSGAFPVVSRKVTILSGQNIVRGTVLGKISIGGKYVKSLSASIDGSEVPVAIAAEAVDATSGDKDGVIYLSGQFNENYLTYGTAHTASSIKDGLRIYSIFLESPTKAV